MERQPWEACHLSVTRKLLLAVNFTSHLEPRLSRDFRTPLRNAGVGLNEAASLTKVAYCDGKLSPDIERE